MKLKRIVTTDITDLDLIKKVSVDQIDMDVSRSNESSINERDELLMQENYNRSQSGNSPSWSKSTPN